MSSSYVDFVFMRSWERDRYEIADFNVGISSRNIPNARLQGPHISPRTQVP